MSSSLLLSFELIYLIEWLLKHEKPRLKLFIKHAVKNGLGEKLQTADFSEDVTTNNEELHNTILDFIEYIESTIHDSLKEKGAASLEIREDLASSLKNINLSNVDPSTIWISVKQAETTINRKLRQNTENTKPPKTKEVLLEKILKNWTPPKKECIN